MNRIEFAATNSGGFPLALFSGVAFARKKKDVHVSVRNFPKVDATVVRDLVIFQMYFGMTIRQITTIPNYGYNQFQGILEFY